MIHGVTNSLEQYLGDQQPIYNTTKVRALNVFTTEEKEYSVPALPAAAQFS